MDENDLLNSMLEFIQNKEEQKQYINNFNNTTQQNNIRTQDKKQQFESFSDGDLKIFKDLSNGKLSSHANIKHSKIGSVEVVQYHKAKIFFIK